MNKRILPYLIAGILVVLLAAILAAEKAISPVIDSGGKEGSMSCEDWYAQIDGDLKRANYCQVDSDCSTIMLGGAYIEFGCFHYVNKSVNQQDFLDRVAAYSEKCAQMIDECAAAPQAVCLNGKCVEKDVE